MEIKFIKLKSGDELVSETVLVADKCILTNPVRLAMDMEGHIQLIPYPIICVSNPVGGGVKIELNNENVLFTLPVNDKCDESYRRAFGHIVEPSKILTMAGFP